MGEKASDLLGNAGIEAAHVDLIAPDEAPAVAQAEVFGQAGLYTSLFLAQQIKSA